MGRCFFHCATLVFLTTLLSCSTSKPQGRTAAESLFQESEQLVAKKRYLMAIENLNQLRSRYPYSFYATNAELMLADIYFLQGNYIEAAAAYILFRDFHPKHKQMAYIVYRIAESFYLQTPSTFDRDLSSAIEAVKYYKEVVQKYPKTKYAELGKNKILEIQKKSDQKEQYIADFYFKTKAYSAARYRYAAIIKSVKDEAIRKHAMARVIESSYHLEEYDQCKVYIDQYLPQLNAESKSRLQGIKDSCQS